MYGASGQLQALIERVAPGPGVHERTLAWHALTEGLASMEVRGQMLDTLNAERIWRDASTSLVRGFQADDVSARRAAPPGPRARTDLALHVVDAAAERADGRLALPCLELTGEGGAGPQRRRLPTTSTSGRGGRLTLPSGETR